ncbi:MAG TPA: DUF4038 domain-containing protein [Nitrososphaerales archaeon]|nr:DUF4038 domain-containing protein [Nitrososphaerales archaeon]
MIDFYQFANSQKLSDNQFRTKHAFPGADPPAAYWSVLCGGFGHVFGNFSIWPFGVQFGNNGAWPPSSEGWWEQLDKSGSVDMMHFGDFFRSRTWYDLIPDQKHKVVIGGLGEFRGLDYLSAAVSSEGRTLIVTFLHPEKLRSTCPS